MSIPDFILVALTIAAATAIILAAIKNTERIIVEKIKDLPTILAGVTATLEAVDAFVLANADANLSPDAQTALDNLKAEAAKLQADAGGTPPAPPA